jgi:hypothetical protein
VLRPILLGGALLTIVLGIGVYFILEEKTIGIALAAFGVIDLLTAPFMLRTIQQGSSGDAPEAPADEAPAQPDPSYNPYARED